MNHSTCVKLMKRSITQIIKLMKRSITQQICVQPIKFQSNIPEHNRSALPNQYKVINSHDTRNVIRIHSMCQPWFSIANFCDDIIRFVCPFEHKLREQRTRTSSCIRHDSTGTENNYDIPHARDKPPHWVEHHQRSAVRVGWVFCMCYLNINRTIRSNFVVVVSRFSFFVAYAFDE